MEARDFSGLISRNKWCFKTDGEGRTVWFPYSSVGRGYYVTKTSLGQIKSLLQQALVSLTLLLLLYILFRTNVTPALTLSFPAATLFATSAAVYGASVKKITSTLEISSLNLASKESASHLMGQYQYVTLFGLLVLTFICSFGIFGLLGVSMALSGMWSGYSWILGSGVVAVLSFSTLRYMMRNRYSSKTDNI